MTACPWLVADNGSKHHEWNVLLPQNPLQAGSASSGDIDASLEWQTPKATLRPGTWDLPSPERLLGSGCVCSGNRAVGKSEK